MNQHVAHLHRDRLYDLLLKHQPGIEAALAEGPGTHDFADVVASVMDGTFQLWCSRKHSSCMVTTIVVYPRKQVLQVFLAAGDLADIKGMYKQVVGWAETNGINTFMLTGRLGWMKALKEYGARFQVTMIMETG
jgi:hypothetical protein